MAPPKKTTGALDLSSLSAADIKKIIRSKDSSGLIIGTDEIQEFCKMSKIRTNIPTFDYMSSGGITEGRWTTLAGNPSACKTTISLQILCAIQKHMEAKGDLRYIFYCDPEGAFDEAYAKGLGLDLTKVIVYRKKVLEEVFERIADLIQQGIIGALVIDSLDGLVPKKTEDNAWSNTMGSLSGALSAHLPNLFSYTLDNNVTTICVRQARVVMQTISPGEIITFSGGKAYRHFQDSVYIMKRLSNRNLTYTPIQFKGEKTRSSRMGLTLDMPLGAYGLDVIRDLVTIAINHDIVSMGGGGWTTFGDIKVQGAEKFVQIVREDPALKKNIYDRVYSEVIDVDTIVGISNTIGEELTMEIEEEIAA